MKYEFKYTLDGEKLSEAEFLKRSRARKTVGTPNMSRSDHWKKHESVALACHPSQAKEFNEKAKKAGLTGVHYRETDGMCMVESPGQLKKELKHRGFHNRDSYS